MYKQGPCITVTLYYSDPVLQDPVLKAVSVASATVLQGPCITGSLSIGAYLFSKMILVPTGKKI